MLITVLWVVLTFIYLCLGFIFSGITTIFEFNRLTRIMLFLFWPIAILVMAAMILYYRIWSD